eukprot:7144457-Prymnesium_polylepis.2
MPKLPSCGWQHACRSRSMCGVSFSSARSASAAVVPRGAATPLPVAAPPPNSRARFAPAPPLAPPSMPVPSSALASAPGACSSCRCCCCCDRRKSERAADAARAHTRCCFV